MATIRIVTDSTSDIPAEVREKYEIVSVPLKVHFGEQSYLDSVDMTPEQFYEKLARTNRLPTTSQPSPVDFLEIYKKLNEGSETTIISIHISSALSGTYQSAVLAKSLLEDKSDIAIFDSKSASYGLGMMAVAAAKAAKQGKNKQEIMEILQHLRNGQRLYFLVDTLEYLQKGGRIGKASALIGSLLNIKPILSIDDEGEVYPVDRVRGKKQAMARIIDLLKKDFGANTPVKVSIAYADQFAAAEQFGEVVKEQFQVKEYSYTTIGPVIGTHVGNGTIAVFMSPFDEPLNH